MFTYAIALTALVFGVIGYLTCYLFEAEVEDVVRRYFTSSKKKQADKEMTQAVELVKTELGGEIIYDNKVD